MVVIVKKGTTDLKIKEETGCTRECELTAWLMRSCQGKGAGFILINSSLTHALAMEGYKLFVLVVHMILVR